MKLDKLAIAKKTVTTIVGFGITKIVKGIIDNNVVVDTLPTKVTVSAASVAIGYSLSEVTSNYTDRKIDELVVLYDKHIRNRKTSDK
jgi:hypothetical protein